MLKNKLQLLPNNPGCYLMKNKSNEIIYVGKAKNLKNRVSSYFNVAHTGKTKALVDNIFDFEYIITNSEKEALLLEINLIKKYDPKYNMLLKDDKTYPYIELTNEEYPRLFIVRNHLKKKTKSKLFGPYPNAWAAKKTLNMLNRIYPLRKCFKMNKKTCLYYHINQCLGYCSNAVDPKKINEMISEITKFLKGNDNIIIKKIEELMYEASSKMNYEKASEMKILLNDINITLKSQHIDLDDNIDRDIFGYYINNDYISIQVFYLRGGKLVERESNIYPLIDNELETLTYYICSFYDKTNLKPKEIFVPSIVDNFLIEDILNIKVITPKKGLKKQLLEMANKNAKAALDEKFEIIKRNEARSNDACLELGSLLNISGLSRIETFDNSHLFGTFSVSGMVVFIDGKPNKKEYRKYKIISDKKDDYSLMKEVIYRRYFRVINDNLIRPDLIIVDGGIIQVNATKEILNDLNLNIPVCGLKKNDKHKTSELLYEDKIIDIDKTSNLFHLLNRIQDEVHNFTIRYHKDIRSKGAIESVLDNVPGVGSKRKTVLLKKYKSIDAIKKVPREELQKYLPIKVAEQLQTYLNNL
ncbi:MAG: excinuclease ABC subunit UvrC [Bacilli bacterium]|nr:excinuclease ABC subunit UvrC [Bacilli bacterium]